MKFAFSQPLGPDCDARSMAARCVALGYDGIELQISNPLEINATAADELRQSISEAAKQIACVSSAICFECNGQKRAKSAADLRAQIEFAQLLDCRQVKMLDVEPSRQSLMAASSAFADWLLPLADHAANRGIQILIENARTFRVARPLWSLMERLNHPAIAVCWNITNSIAAGERPAVTVPTLNSRIRYVRTSNIEIHEPLIRLMGIGYTGWVTLLPPPDNMDKFLADSLSRCHEWTTPQVIKSGKSH